MNFGSDFNIQIKNPIIIQLPKSTYFDSKKKAEEFIKDFFE